MAILKLALTIAGTYRFVILLAVGIRGHERLIRLAKLLSHRVVSTLTKRCPILRAASLKLTTGFKVRHDLQSLD